MVNIVCPQPRNITLTYETFPPESCKNGEQIRAIFFLGKIITVNHVGTDLGPNKDLVLLM